MNFSDNGTIQNIPYVGVHVPEELIDKFNQQKLDHDKVGKKKARLQKMNQIANTNLFFFFGQRCEF